MDDYTLLGCSFHSALRLKAAVRRSPELRALLGRVKLDCVDGRDICCRHGAIGGAGLIKQEGDGRLKIDEEGDGIEMVHKNEQE
jgi:hypothetical protein